MLNADRIFKTYYVTNRLYIGLSEIKPLSYIKKIEETDVIENYPQVTYKGKKVTLISAEKTKADAVKAVYIDTKNLYAGGKDVLCFGFNGRTVCDRIKIKLSGANNLLKEYEISVLSERWNYILIDLSGCNFLNAVDKIELQFYGVNVSELFSDIFEISDMYFGNILDFSFKKGRAQNYFTPENVILKGVNCLIYKYLNGETLNFPNLFDPEYTLLDMNLSVKSAIKITADCLNERKKYILYYITDKDKNFDERKKIDFEVSGYGIQSYIIELGTEFSENERLFSIKIKPFDKSGALKIYDVAFIQNKNFLEDEDAAAFLHKKKKFSVNPYKFAGSRNIYSAKDFGARGNFYTDDTSAVQSAIAAAGRESGKVVLENGFFIISHIELLSGVELVIDKTAVVIQSENAEDYKYGALYGHDNLYSKISWPHNFLVHNKPLIYADNAENIKITGGGTIRMADGGSSIKLAGFPYWPSHCGGTIHIAPLGFNNCKNIEISEITVTRASTYHCFFVKCENVFVNCVNFYDVRCLSADGIGLCGSKNVKINNSLIVTNDDGITLFSVYNDPRAGGWWKCAPGENNSVENIEISGCYINSAYGGGGKAIAFIPWGSDAPNQELQLIKNIYVHNCILKGGHSVGTWCDNPYHGKMPFDNSELDDYSPVEDIKLKNNKYCNSVDLMEIKVTNCITDNALHSSYKTVNGDFKNGFANWKLEGIAEKTNSDIKFKPHSVLYQILSSEIGDNIFEFEVSGKGCVFIDGTKKYFDEEKAKKIRIQKKYKTEKNIKVGIYARNVVSVLGVEKL